MNLKAALKINLKNGDYILTGDGIIKDALIEYKRLDQVSLHLTSSEKSTEITGNVIFERDQGSIDYIGLYDEQNESIDFQLNDFDLSFLDGRNLSGKLNGTLRIGREPNLNASFHLKAHENVTIYDVSLDQPQFWYDSKKDLFQFKLRSKDSKVLVNGKHDVLELIVGLDPRSYIESMESVQIEVFDKSLKRYADLESLSYFNFRDGKLEFKCFFFEGA